ncbi:sporulation histidine kinase inhibitor Sda [Paenibacillus sp. TAB 01]|uniref:sporulation histidine kinase inhibitor Sda n=1 Tax=Paenibacillus sp. TAB 01 TaxID=3368988 RepID=UPI0037529642
MYKEIPDEDLVECYVNAVQMQLDTDFLGLLLDALEKRNLHVPVEVPYFNYKLD